MRHWLRNLPDMDSKFVEEHIEPLESLYRERGELTRRITKTEIDVHHAVLNRWTPDQVRACFETSIHQDSSQ
ncbi:hypothetical protein EGT36_28510 [Agrobacterium sp. FDAARGOS_525]|nr:hypothetical protein EGT36_29490 [Agrobacterium sp. FDAARGOS_525]RSC24772.1 hypothetical protein EGT36_28510 [Agrobacterium sp. FDAARGOS_525]